MQYGFPYCIFAYLRFPAVLPVDFPAAFLAVDITFCAGALGAGFFPVDFAGAFAAGLPLAGALGGGAV